jgi:L-aminopeptidase/D-esterase-like protein
MPVPLSNDHAELVPQTSFDGPHLEFDFPGLRIGVAEYANGPTGCTVFMFDKQVVTEVDVRGGSPGTLGNYPWNKAICLAGGSLYGLEAATGVAAELYAQGGYSTAFHEIATVSGAIVYDFVPGRSQIYPDKALGRAAAQVAQPGRFPLGAHGAGRSVGCGWFDGLVEPSGQGGAFRTLGPIKIAAFSVVNAAGAIHDRDGRVIRGNLNPATGERISVQAALQQRTVTTPPPSGNTTLTVVITNQELSREALRQVARQVHSSMARAIQPFHTMYDGDVLFAVTTNEVKQDSLEPGALGVLAAEVVWDAVLSIPAQPGRPA